jgi:ATP-dependent helicase/nuclease subunit B
VLSIPNGVSFAETLAAELLRQVAGDPLKLADMTVLLPNRRACRTLQEAFLRAALSPNIVPPPPDWGRVGGCPRER